MIWPPEKIRALLVLFTSFFSVAAVAGQQTDNRNIELVKAPVGRSVSESIANINQLIAAGKSSVAENIVRRHLELYPRDADYLIILSRILHESGKSGEAIKILRRARAYSKKYEDIYLFEAAILSSLDKVTACKERDELAQDYYKYTSGLKAEMFEEKAGAIQRGKNELVLGVFHDKLNNNRGTWNSSVVMNKWEDCKGNNAYIGYNTVKRYGIGDAEVIIGGGWRYGGVGVELEYRDSHEENILAQQSWFGIASVGTGLSTDVLLTGSVKKYFDVEASSLGMGVDYYFGNYELLLIRSKTEYPHNSLRLDSSYVNQYRIGYFFTKTKYMRFGYFSGKELVNDGGSNYLYSKTKTISLEASLPLTSNANLLVELKRHYQSGFYEQNGIGITLRYEY